jgi:hypothetical protein
MNRSTWKKGIMALLCMGMMIFSSGALFAGDTPYDGDPDRDQIRGGEGADRDQIPDRDRISNPEPNEPPAPKGTGPDDPELLMLDENGQQISMDGKQKAKSKAKSKQKGVN